ncbi:MAG TPA: prenyltransferase/squalene oxidase repeat-containing protein [Chthoniobacter sp.]|nr:prenyltransferase/squalene oxidase repeat-containing protein [Chthoniobacter sp.]
MNAHPPVVRLLIAVLALSAFAARAEEPPKPDEALLRAATVKSLAYLDKEADTWMNEQTCNGCHHMPALLWSHREAQRRGFVIDPKMFAEFVDWSSSLSKEAKPVPESAALMKLAMPEKAMPALTDLVIKSQQPDGSWKPASQFNSMQRRGPQDATSNTARMLLLALGTQPDAQAATDTARAQAAALFAKDEPAKSVDTLVWRTLYAQRFGPPADVAPLRAELLKHQHADGGWGYMIGEETSDSLATGEALYLLQQAPDPGSASAVARAQAWLLSHQREDGGWDIDITKISKIDRSAPDKAKSLKAATGIYTFWGSAWATIGLVEGFPVSESAK